MQRIGVVGLGNMGEGMAMNLVAKGFPTAVRDVRPEPVRALVDLGATAAESCAHLGSLADAVMVAVFSEQQVIDSVLGVGDDAGLIEGMAPGGVICINSTVSPELIQQLAAGGASSDITVIDVAMSGGGDVAARAGALTFMAGGDRSAFDRVRPALDAMATTVHHVGPLGAGVTAKILNNLLAVENVSSVREAMRLSRALGFEDADILTIIGTAVGASWVSNNWERIRVQEAGHPQGKGGIASMANKDLHLAMDLSSSTATPMPLLEFVIGAIVPELEQNGMTGD